MANLSIKSGDNVVVIAGKDKGKKGKVLAVSPSTARVIVEGVNIVSRHKKPRSAQDQGGIIKHEAPISASNVMVLCPVCGKATRVHHTVVDGKKVRVCKCGEVLDKKYSKATAKKAEKTETAKKAKSTKKVEANDAETKEVAKKPATKKTTASKTTAKKAEEKIVATKSSKVAAKPAVRKTKKDV